MANLRRGVCLLFQPSPQPVRQPAGQHNSPNSAPFVSKNLSDPSTKSSTKSKYLRSTVVLARCLAHAHRGFRVISAFHICPHVIPLARCLRFETKRGRQTSAFVRSTFQVKMHAYPYFERGFGLSRRHPLRERGCVLSTSVPFPP